MHKIVRFFCWQGSIRCRTKRCVRSYDLGANVDIVKPAGSGSFTMALRTIPDFWHLLERPGGDL